jgi:tetratricopeptide (TPR) repeat protein
MVNSTDTSELVSQAWQYHRNNKTDQAVAEFEKVVSQHPRDIDANYGLGLSQKAAGQTEAAIKTFKTALELIDESKKTYEATRDTSLEAENVRTPEDDRFQMLSRMVEQRLAELQRATDQA